MPAPSPSAFTLTSLALTALIVALAGLLRGRAYALFAAVLLGVHTAISRAIYPSFEWAWPLFVYLHATVYLHFGSLVWASMRPRPYRALVSLPGSFFWAGTFLALPWAIAAGFGFEPRLVWIPYLLALVGLVQSVSHRPEEVDVTLDGATVAKLARHPHGSARVERPLRLVQITDPHLGPFMSERRLRRLVERAVAKDPDLVLLTGDFLTMESHGAEAALTHALEPLKALCGRVFACMGNHDHEAPEVVAGALHAVGARLLIDDEEVVETPSGPVQILGLDFHFRNRRERIQTVCRAHPRIEGALRLVLLHDPGAFVHVPEGDGDLVLAGHTHGGQLGLLSLGLRHTAVSALSKIPDHGLWAHGSNRLYVHRGTGHYGFPLRVGVPSEESVVRVHRVERGSGEPG